MHKDGEENITLENISKIEGHGSLDIKIKDNKVEYAKLKITESKRFYTQAIKGKSALGLPPMTSRICGTCSIAHLTCCSEAVENAIGYVPSDQTVLLRKLSINGMMIRDHAMHLFIFSLPDLFGKDSVLDFEDDKQELIRKAFAIKSAGNNLSKAIAGRAIHATFAEVGKFAHVPDKTAIDAVVKELKSVRDYTIEFIDIFYKCDFSLFRDTDFVSMVTDDYSFLHGDMHDSKGLSITKDNYLDYLDRIVIPYSQATAYELQWKEYVVGALARMNLNRDKLHPDTRRDAQKYIGAFPSSNVYHNNLAQAIEILNCIDRSVEILESNEFKEEQSAPVVIKPGTGVGLLEAPRGTLYYMLTIGNDGKIADGTIIVPTQQNQIAMEKTVIQVVEQNLDKEREQIEHEIEKVIRAYDPCMSCASHFLKINWKK